MQFISTKIFISYKKNSFTFSLLKFQKKNIEKAKFEQNTRLIIFSELREQRKV